MTNNINPINIGAKGINYYGANKEEKTEQKLDKQVETPKSPVQKEVSAEETLGFLAAQSSYLQPQVKKLDVSKYVTPEQAQRIAGFVASFEGEVEKGLKTFDKEFGAKTLSESAKLDVVVEQFNKLYM